MPLLLPMAVLMVAYRLAWPSWSWGKPNILAALKPPVRLWKIESLTKETEVGTLGFSCTGGGITSLPLSGGMSI